MNGSRLAWRMSGPLSRMVKIALLAICLIMSVITAAYWIEGHLRRPVYGQNWTAFRTRGGTLIAASSWNGWLRFSLLEGIPTDADGAVLEGLEPLVNGAQSPHYDHGASRPQLFGLIRTCSLAWGTWEAQTVLVPHWLVLALWLIYPAVTLAGIPLRRRRRRRAGLCVRCAYDLTGNESGICPECSADVRG